MKKLDIIYEDKEILVVNKPYNKLVIATSKSNNTLYHEVREYLHKKNQKVFIVHRLDKDTSGVILFAKNEKIKHLLQDNWNNITKRYYVCVVNGSVKKDKDRLINYLKESKTLQVYVSDNGSKAITNYKVIKKNNKYSMLDIFIETGRRNQIRCQLANIGYPIIGDKKYDCKVNPINRLGLHANKLVLRHPITNKEYVFESSIPNNFLKLF